MRVYLLERLKKVLIGKENIKMKKKIAFLLRGFRHYLRNVGEFIDHVRLKYMLFLNNVEYESINSHGMPYFCVGLTGKCIIGNNFSMNNGLRFNPIGFPQPCTIYVGENAKLRIGNNVGISQTSIICHKEIEIQDNVKIGGGTKVFDTDFHSINYLSRRNFKEDMNAKKMVKVTIGHDAFIGAGCIILKGVTIGACSVVGAGSVVTKNVPSGEIWAGNPAKFIRKI